MPTIILLIGTADIMSHPYHHSLSSVKKFGGCTQDYQAIHDWFDESKEHLGDVRHRALRHHSQGIFECERVFGSHIKNKDGKVIPVRFIAEQHVIEDLGEIPTLCDWLREMPLKSWMAVKGRKLSEELTNNQKDINNETK